MKSSVCYSILYNNAKHHGTRSVYMTLEQSKENLLQQMNLMGMNDPKVQEKVYVLDLATIRKNVTEMMSKGSWLQVFKMYAETVKKDQGFDILVLDSLDVLEMAAQLNNDRRNDLFYLFMWLRNMGITSFLISETLAGPDVQRGRFEEGYLADGVISLKLQNIGETDVQRRIRGSKIAFHQPQDRLLLAHVQRRHVPGHPGHQRMMARCRPLNVFISRSHLHRLPKGSWSSGYDVCFTRRRSPVRIRLSPPLLISRQLFFEFNSNVLKVHDGSDGNIDLYFPNP